MHETVNVNNESFVCRLAKVLDDFSTLYHKNVVGVFVEGFDVEDLDN